jgi:hypothetical protein
MTDRGVAIFRVGLSIGSALLGGSLLAVARMAGPAKRNQKVLPRHPALRFAPGSFVPSLLRGSAYKGHPWPFTPFAASMRLTPLRNDSAHPPEGAIGVA